MYVVLYKKKVIAFHDEKRVVKCYTDRVKSRYDERLVVCKVKKKDEKNINQLYDLYLVRYGDTYIQSGYMEYLQLADPQLEYDHQYAKDVLMKVLEIEDLNKKEKRAIKDSVTILEGLIDIDRKYTPTLEELQRLQDQYAPYIYEKGK